MNIAVVSAAGRIGSRIVQEALNRGHHVTAVVRHPEKVTLKHDNLKVVQGDATNLDSLINAVKGSKVIISAYSPGFMPNDDQSLFSVVGRNLIDAVTQTPGSRVIVVGGAGSLEIAPGVKLFDTEQFPAEWLDHAKSSAAAFGLLRESDIDWTYVSPSIEIEPGERTGKFRVGKDSPLFDEQGRSHISMEDYSVALIDEVEKPQFVRQRFTVGY